MSEKPKIPARTLSLAAALERGLKELGELTDRDAALVQLARLYVAELADGGELWRIGARLMDCLKELGMTPAARRAVTPRAEPQKPAGGDQDAELSPADQLAQRRARARERRAATVDASAP